MGADGTSGDAGTGDDGEGNPNPPPSPPGNTDSITLLLTFSIIASLRMNT